MKKYISRKILLKFRFRSEIKKSQWFYEKRFFEIENRFFTQIVDFESVTVRFFWKIDDLVKNDIFRTETSKWIFQKKNSFSPTKK